MSILEYWVRMGGYQVLLSYLLLSELHGLILGGSIRSLTIELCIG